MAPADTYTHGHHESVLRSHTWRTAENSAAYLLPHLRVTDRLLDVGCGPGTITLDLARRLGAGRVVGIENTASALETSRPNAERAALDNVTFELGDVYALEYADDSFDVVHAHQVLQHLSDPVAALREMRRVCVPGGLVAARDSDYGAMTWYPDVPALDDWLDLYHRITRGNHAEADAGRFFRRWTRAAGFEEFTLTTSAWCFSTPEERAWWSELWADRVTKSAFADQATERGLATREDLERLRDGWREWAADEDAWFGVLHSELLGRA